MNVQQIEANKAELAGKTVFVGYEAGRQATSRAIAEARPARDAGINLTQYVGKVDCVRRARNGDQLITIFAFDRGRNGEGRYRVFNPSLGRLRTFEVLE